MPAWKVWGELKRRPHIELRREFMADNAGLIEDLGDGRRRITLDKDIDQCERRATLAHELVHDECDILFEDDTPPYLVRKFENYVDAETARRLVPLDELEQLVRDRVVDGGRVTWREVNEWFDVPKDVAVQALEALQVLAMQRHASTRAEPEWISEARVADARSGPPRRYSRPSPPAEDGPHIYD